MRRHKKISKNENITKVVTRYSETLDQIFQAGFLHGRFYTYRRTIAEQRQEYNIFNTTADVATAQFYFLIIYKLFDYQSDLTLEAIVQWREDEKLRCWFEKENKRLETTVEAIKKRRHNLIAHRNQTTEENPSTIDSDHKLQEQDIEELKSFLVDFLAQLKLSVFGLDPAQTRKSYLDAIKSLEELCEEDMRKTLISFQEK